MLRALCNTAVVLVALAQGSGWWLTILTHYKIHDWLLCDLQQHFQMQFLVVSQFREQSEVVRSCSSMRSGWLDSLVQPVQSEWHSKQPSKDRHYDSIPGIPDYNCLSL